MNVKPRKGFNDEENPLKLAVSSSEDVLDDTSSEEATVGTAGTKGEKKKMPSKKTGGLGRDFYSLFTDNIPENSKSATKTLRIADIEPRSNQPRKNFDIESLQTLSDSIRTYGVIQPIVVRENISLTGSYEIIAGERRWRAAKMAGLDEIPVVILDGDDLKAAQVSIIENIQREDLNPVEEALAYQSLIDKFGLTQDQVSQQVGKSRSNIANMLRLLDLPEDVLDLLRDGLISTGHARALLGLVNPDDVSVLAGKILNHDMTVREVEKAVKVMNDAANATDDMEDAQEKSEANLRRVYIRDLEHRILNKLGRKARITNTPKKKIIELSYNDDEDLEYLLKELCGSDFFDEGKK